MTLHDNAQREPPVKVGELLTIVPSGRGAKDPFYSSGGFIVFIKNWPPHKPITATATIKISAIKGSFGFADYQDVRW